MNGRILQISGSGGLVRLESGELATLSSRDFLANKARYERLMSTDRTAEFDLRRSGRRVVAELAVQLHDAEFEEKLAGYMRESESTLGLDGVIPD